VRGYTIAQVGAFMGAIERAARRRRHAEALDARMAQADGKAWKAYIRAIEQQG